MIKPIIAVGLIGLAAFGLSKALSSNSACMDTHAGISHEGDLVSAVVSASDAALDEQDWGNFRAYFTGQTYGTEGALSGLANIRAGEQIHAPHRHADEEYLLITQGEGTWHLNGKDFPAKAGDMLYAAPWDYHGVKAAPNSDLQFVVVKWGNKAMAAPVDPDPSLPELLGGESQGVQD